MLRTLPADSPCRMTPWAALPVGAKCLCYAAGVLLALLDWADRRRRCR